jgi:glycosyltransferase involved in cell wall biosynthesis
LTHRRHAYLVPRGEPGILAEAILDLKGDPALRDRLAREGYQLYQSQFTPTALGKRMLGHLNEVLDR